MKIDRGTLIENLASHMADEMSYNDLIQYFYEGTIDFLSDLSDEELLDQAEWAGYTSNDEVDDNTPHDYSDDAEWLASAGMGTHEDYGHYGD